MMLPITLHRIDPARHMSRFYRLDVQADLFGGWDVVREWGRIGCAGRIRINAYPSRSEAVAWTQRQQKTKHGRGYQPIHQ